MAHTHQDRDKLLARVRRIAGQVAAVERSLEAEAPCAETLHLVAAVRGAVAGLMEEILEEHLFEHVARPGLTDAERRAGADEIATLIKRYGR